MLASTQRTRWILTAACLVLLGLSIVPALSSPESPDGLADCVRFLSQPKLAGRKTRTAGARLARQYIEKEFQSDGLLPWASADRYELSFGLGKNVVGVVPGADTNVASEIVLLSAHYDHLGKDRKGKICPGAADNASGVAVLLEVARRFASAKQIARRTVAFAAFDAEEQMLLGSFAFCCRTDVTQAKIVAVVNVDMLGRDFLDAVTNTVFVAGTESYPALQTEVRQLGSTAGIRILPLGSDLVGPRSDHVAFESRDIPCLFFSCGTFRDYHRPGDTAEKLDYPNLARAAQVIGRTVEALANTDPIRAPVRAGCDVEELKSVQAIVSELCQNPQKAGIKTNDMSALFSLQGRVEKLLADGTYTFRTREELILEVTRRLGSYFLPLGDEGPPKAEGTTWSTVLPYLEHIYLNYHRELLEGQRQLVAHVLTHPPGLFHGIPPFGHEIYDIPAEDISVEQTADGRFTLHALGNGFTMTIRGKPLIWPFGVFQGGLSASSDTLDCEGSRQQLLDYCLLYMRGERTNQLHTLAMRKVLSAITGTQATGGYDEWLQNRLTQGGYANETEWLLSCLSNGPPELINAALFSTSQCKDPLVADRVREIFCNRDVRPDVRSHAIQSALEHPNKATLLALTEVLDDRNPVYKREYCPQFSPDYPLADRLTFQTLRPFWDQTYSHPFISLGQTALDGLKKATKRNFGTNAQKWRAFLESHETINEKTQTKGHP